MDSQRRLEELFTHFPGIGPRQARRFVYYLLSRPGSVAKELATLIEEVKKTSYECELCHRFFIGQRKQYCSVCSDPNRDQSTLMIVARDSDFESIEKSGAYKGLYFILGGTVPILDKEPERKIRLKQLLERLSNLSNNNPSQIKEIILSLSTTPDGEHTTTIVKEALVNSGSKTFFNGKISLLGRGLSTGAELEYADEDTIKNALENRH
jgi:recombination protein RecR